MQRAGFERHTRRRWRGPVRPSAISSPSDLLRAASSAAIAPGSSSRPATETRLAGAIAVASDGYLHYYLGGTADGPSRDSPMKNLFAAMIALAAELGLPLNLGGGLDPGDSLEEFKRGFANGEAPFRTHELVCDPADL